MKSLLQKLSLGSIGTSRQNAIGPPRLVSPIRFPYGPFQFKAHVGTDVPYHVEASSNLMAWETICSGRARADMDFVDSDASKFSHRFYRLSADGVLSCNVTGYVTSTLSPGFSTVANPLRSEDSRIATLFKGMPDGMTVSRFDARTHELAENTLQRGKWSNESQALAPGDGAIVFNPGSDYRPLSFVGDVLLGNSSIPIPAGFSLRGPLVPQAGRLDTELAFPIGEGDVIHLFDRDKQSYVLCSYLNKAWTPHPPVIGVGESFWIAKKEARNWVSVFPPTNP